MLAAIVPQALKGKGRGGGGVGRARSNHWFQPLLRDQHPASFLFGLTVSANLATRIDPIFGRPARICWAQLRLPLGPWVREYRNQPHVLDAATYQHPGGNGWKMGHF